jgi:hypothetical protein
MQLFDLARVLVHANDIEAELRKARPGDETNIAGTDDRNLHINSFI